MGEMMQVSVQQGWFDGGCSSGPGLTVSFCSICRHRGTMDADMCVDEHEDCPMHVAKQDISCAMEGKSGGRSYTKNKPCEFPGCNELCAGTGKYGNVCQRHLRLIHNRVLLGWPESKLYDVEASKKPVKKCDFPSCKKLVTSKYCHYHQQLIYHRKKRGWSESRLHDPLVEKYMGKEIWRKKCAM